MKLTLMAIFRADDELSSDEDDEIEPPPGISPPGPPPAPASAELFSAWPKLAAAELAIIMRDDELAPHKLIANG